MLVKNDYFDLLLKISKLCVEMHQFRDLEKEKSEMIDLRKKFGLAFEHFVKSENQDINQLFFSSCLNQYCYMSNVFQAWRAVI